MTLGIQHTYQRYINGGFVNITLGPRNINVSEFVPTFSPAELEEYYKLEESRMRNKACNYLHDFKKGK